jgi:hypothetical protein
VLAAGRSAYAAASAAMLFPGGPCEASMMADGPGSPGGVEANVKEAGLAICSFSAVLAAGGWARMGETRKE